MLKECIEVPSIGSLIIAAIAFVVAIFQGWIYQGKKHLAWVGWGVLTSLATGFYAITNFINYNAIYPPLLVFNERCQYMAVLFIVHTNIMMIYLFLRKQRPVAKRLFIMANLGWLAFIWLGDLVITPQLITRNLAWLSFPYVEPDLGPLAPLLFIYCVAVIGHGHWLLLHNYRHKLPGFHEFLIGFGFWSLLGINDILGTLGQPVGMFMMEFGFLGFCFALVGVAIKHNSALERSLRQAQKIEILGMIAAGVAHDFNNLLSVISVNTEMMLTRFGHDPQMQKGLERVSQAAKRGGELVRGLLSLGRQGPTQRHPLDLNKEIKRVTGMLSSAMPPTICLEMNLSPHIPAINAVPAQIEQVLLNLCLNARDAMVQGGKLALATCHLRVAARDAKATPHLSAGDYVLLTVADTGQGMDQDTLAQAFSPFFTTKLPGKGSGLGLATVQGIMDSSGGAVTCQSAPGQGTSFSLYWPVADRPVEVVAPPVAHDGAFRPVAGLSLLLVDDEIAILESMGDLLGRQGYEVLKARNGQEAVEVFQSQPVGLVIMDLHMPGMATPACLQRLREINPQVKVIVVTGDVAKAKELLPANGNVLAHLEKPVRINRLHSLLADALKA